MAEKKEFIDYVEFYITNSCNFNCTGCNRFNNYAFTGHQRWADYKDIYRQWAEKIEFNDYYILGGEPMSNPDLLEWITGIRSLWQNTNNAVLVTNGSYEKKFNKELYNVLVDTNTNLEVGVHNINRREHVLELILDFIAHPAHIIKIPDINLTPTFEHLSNSNYVFFDVKHSSIPAKPHELKSLIESYKFWETFNEFYKMNRTDLWPEDVKSMNDWNNLADYMKDECLSRYNFSPEIEQNFQLEYVIIDANNLKININLENFFHQGALVAQPEKNSFTLHDSDPNIAHDICHTKNSHHFIKGKLNKCGTSFLFDEFDKQFNLDLSEEDRNLIQNVPVGTVDMSGEELSIFIENLKNPIPQCKFCPQNYEFSELFSSSKKSVFGKKK